MQKIVKYSFDKTYDITIKNNSKVKYIPNFLNDQEIKIYFNHLKNDVSWIQGEYKMFGKPIKTPRLLWAMKEKDFEIPDGYSVTGSTEFTSLIKKLKLKVEKITKTKLLYAQINYYRDGNDYIGWHSDKEVSEGDIIASISLGAKRRFTLRHKNYKKDKETPKHEFVLNNGSLIILDYNAANKYWKHILPKMKKVTEPRINITFRNK